MPKGGFDFAWMHPDDATEEEREQLDEACELASSPMLLSRSTASSLLPRNTGLPLCALLLQGAAAAAAAFAFPARRFLCFEFLTASIPPFFLPRFQGTAP